ncbi:nuclear transport factor 2 family protein [Luedemannella flava]
MSTVDTESLTNSRIVAAVHRVEVGALLDRYLIALDSAELDDTWAGSLFTTDAVVEFPVGRHDGIAGLAAFHRTALAKFDRTQHLNSPPSSSSTATARTCARTSCPPRCCRRRSCS